MTWWHEPLFQSHIALIQTATNIHKNSHQIFLENHLLKFTRNPQLARPATRPPRRFSAWATKTLKLSTREDYENKILVVSDCHLSQPRLTLSVAKVSDIISFFISFFACLVFLIKRTLEECFICVFFHLSSKQHKGRRIINKNINFLEPRMNSQRRIVPSTPCKVVLIFFVGNKFFRKLLRPSNFHEINFFPLCRWEFS